MPKKKIKEFQLERASGLATALCVAAIFTGTFFIKFAVFDKGVNLSAGEFGLFRVEEATRYRYAKLAGEGIKIPVLDKRIQYPEGLNVRKHFTTLSERTMGFIYRLFRFKTPFYRFVIIFMFLYSSLSVIACYKMAFLLTKTRFFSIIASLFYAGNFSSSSRTIAGGLVEEDFALPLMFFALMFIIKSFGSRRRFYEIFAGVLIALAMSSWHVSQFFYLILIGVFTAIYIFKTDEKNRIFSIIFPIVLIQAAAGAVVPVLRGGYFILSFSQLLGYAFIVSHVISVKFVILRKYRIFFLLLIMLSFSFFFAVSRPVVREHEKNYAHVYSLMWNKIKYMGNKPTFNREVKKLPFDTKVLWQSSFVSPDAGFIKDIFLLVFIFSIPGIVAAAIRIKRCGDSRTIMNFAFLLSFFILFLLIKRLYVYVIFFLCLFIPYINDFLKRNFVRLIAAVIFLCGGYFQSKQVMRQLRAIPHRIDNYKQDVLRWMNGELPPESVILSNIGFAPEIVQNSSFSTVLHNHYEAKDIRDKTKEFYECMYKSENDLYNFAKKYGAEYLLYHWEFLIDKSVNSVRYQVDAMSLFRSAVCYKLHFATDELKHFELLYQNEYYRVFKILKEGRSAAPRAVNYVPFFDRRVFEPSDKITYLEGRRDEGPVFDDEYAKVKMDAVWSLPKLKGQADALAAGGEMYKAEEIYLKMLEADPYYKRTRIILADFYMRAGLFGKAVAQTEWIVGNYPDAESFYFLISALRANGEKSRAAQASSFARGRYPADPRFR